jgi:hypothetical protein
MVQENSQVGLEISGDNLEFFFAVCSRQNLESLDFVS